MILIMLGKRFSLSGVNGMNMFVVVTLCILTWKCFSVVDFERGTLVEYGE